MVKTLLIPLDGSALGERALPYALHLARAAGTRLLLMQANPDLATADLALLTRMEAEFGIAVTVELHRSAFRQSSVATTLGTTGCLSSNAIMQWVRENHVDLIVMSIQGAVADDVLRQSEVPVLLVPPTCDRQWQRDRPLRLMVPLDGSPYSETALASAHDMAGLVCDELFLVRAVQESTSDPYRSASMSQLNTMLVGNASLTEARQYLESVAGTQGTAFASVDYLTDLGDPARVIDVAARAKNVDLISMAIHDRHDDQWFPLGSAVATVLQQTQVPILLVPVKAPLPTADLVAAAAHQQPRETAARR
jgi:nucleotide-binding universal stress UspA family protein